uniref:DUF4283 domain-containing protein n=1 Tax=Tanacetum cinerariifolium TaxID=118510 RepID=A0A699H1H4_TANCI|nr:hypothetical protein [Tanacetum cinerariifolium]
MDDLVDDARKKVKVPLKKTPRKTAFGRVEKRTLQKETFGCGGMERGFLSQKDSGRGRGVKKKDLHGNKRNTTSDIGLSTESNDTMNDDTLVCVSSFSQEGVTPSMVNMTVVMEKQNYLDDTTVLKYFPPLSTPVTSTAGNVPDGLDSMLENSPWFIQNNPLILKKWHPDENLLKEDVNNIFVVMPKITREVHYTCNVRVEYEWKPLRCSSCKIFRHIHEECPKNSGAGEKKTVKKPSQLLETTASTSSNKKKGVEPTIEVSNSNPFDVLNSVDNDVEFGTNGGTTSLVNNEATSSGSSFINLDNDGEFVSNTPIW